MTGVPYFQHAFNRSELFGKELPFARGSVRFCEAAAHTSADTRIQTRNDLVVASLHACCAAAAAAREIERGSGIQERVT
jgi:hypothetical protein